MKRRLSDKTFKRYTVERIANHIDNYQLSNNIDEYRFDFQSKKIYTKAGNHYYYYMDMSNNTFNKLSIQSILEAVYRLHDIQLMQESIKQMKGA